MTKYHANGLRPADHNDRASDLEASAATAERDSERDDVVYLLKRASVMATRAHRSRPEVLGLVAEIVASGCALR